MLLKIALLALPLALLLGRLLVGKSLPAQRRLLGLFCRLLPALLLEFFPLLPLLRQTFLLSFCLDSDSFLALFAFLLALYATSLFLLALLCRLLLVFLSPLAGRLYVGECMQWRGVRLAIGEMG